MSNAERPESRGITRRDLLTLGVGAFVVAAVPVAAWRRHVLVRRTLPAMGTLAEFAVVARQPAAAHAAIDAAAAELGRVETLMSRFSPTSDVGRANHDARREAVTVSASTAAVLRAAIAWAEASDAAFDPCVGRLVRLWDVGHRSTPPPEASARLLAGRRLYRALDVDAWRGGPAVRFTSPEAEIDLGGIAKGYGVDRAVEALRARGVDRAIVNVGGDLYALGEAADGEPWRVGIRSPDDPHRLAGELAVRDAAVATSGDYLQFFTFHGRRYHHILDPATGAPRLTPVHSVTVTADTCMDADAAATTVFGLPAGRVDNILRARPGRARLVRVIAGGPDGSA